MPLAAFYRSLSERDKMRRSIYDQRPNTQEDISDASHRQHWLEIRNFSITHNERLLRIANHIALPETFDARVKWPLCASIRKLENQGACGSCWVKPKRKLNVRHFQIKKFRRPLCQASFRIAFAFGQTPSVFDRSRHRISWNAVKSAAQAGRFIIF